MTARLIPELEVEGLDRSLAFYIGIIGFTVLYARPQRSSREEPKDQLMGKLLPGHLCYYGVVGNES